MPQSVAQYGAVIENHLNWSDKQQDNTKKNERMQQLATQPGQHAGNRDRQQVACAALSLLSVFSSVENTHVSPAINAKRADKLAAEERIAHADNLYRGKIVERAINRDVIKNSGQNSRAENARKKQDGSSEQRPAALRRAGASDDRVRPAKGPLSTTHPTFVSDKVITSAVFGNAVHSTRGVNSFSTMLDRVANVLHKTGQYISRHGPVRFPGASASTLPDATSVQISKDLEKLISPEMFAQNVDAARLSGPDSYGLRWDEKGNAYLKVRNKFIKISKLNGNRFSLAGPIKKHNRIILRFKNDKFKIETARERLKNILETGFGGRKRKTAASVLKEQDGFTEESARQLLTEYNFPEKGFYSDYMFALDVEQTGKIPQWAEKLKKRPRSDGSQKEIIETIMVAKPEFPQHKLKFNLGDILSEGNYGEVYFDADDKEYLIKKLPVENFKYFIKDHLIKSKLIEIATHESEMFNRFYGENASMVLVDESGNVYIRMYRVPGETLGSLRPGSLPDDAEQRFVDMIEKLSILGIMHGDLHAENILWDKNSRFFYPIDIKNIREEYFKSDTESKIGINESDEDIWCNLLEEIESKKNKPALLKIA